MTLAETEDDRTTSGAQWFDSARETMHVLMALSEEGEKAAKEAMAGPFMTEYKGGKDPRTGRPYPDTKAQARQSKRRADALEKDLQQLANSIAAAILGIEGVFEQSNGCFTLRHNEAVIRAYSDAFNDAHSRWDADPKKGVRYASFLCNRVSSGVYVHDELQRMLADQQGMGTPALTQKDITRLPASLFLPLDKVYSGLDTYGYGAKQKVLVNGKKEPELVVDVMLSADDVFDGVTTSRTLTTREKYIYRDIMSFWHAGIMQFDAATAWKNSTGQKRTPRPEEVAEYEADIEMYMRTVAAIDYSEELRRRNPGIKGGVYREPLLNLGVLTIRRDNGTEAKVYRFLSAPILYRHNVETGKQMSSCPRGLIEACAKDGSVTEDRYNIRCYLTDRIAHMKRKDEGKGKRPQVSNRIKLETVMDETGMDKTSSSEKRRARIIIEGYLNVFVEQRFIRGWKPVAGKRGVAEAHDIEV